MLTFTVKVNWTTLEAITVLLKGRNVSQHL